ncbi:MULTISPECIES: hypothetical protein [unclassified Ruminococcus]|uniref:hypothetical protein n=1 Tax=unclassified Ruminococcus TaxID=2608920 RepID=UPI00210C01F9|nr:MULTISPECIES: hypothetical protein [unclassified Ruminococcus]
MEFLYFVKNETITTIGNPIDYRDGMKFTWKNGRQLATLTKNDKTTSYSYDISGIRTQKILTDWQQSIIMMIVITLFQ